MVAKHGLDCPDLDSGASKRFCPDMTPEDRELLTRISDRSEAAWTVLRESRDEQKEIRSKVDTIEEELRNTINIPERVETLETEFSEIKKHLTQLMSETSNRQAQTENIIQALNYQSSSRQSQTE